MWLEELVVGIFRFFFYYLLIELFFNTVVRGTGKLLIRPFIKGDPDLHDDVTVVVVGLAFWVVVALVVVRYSL